MKTEPITQMNFDFKDWKECFKVLRDNLEIYGDEMQLVISTHFLTSGYWIEEKGKDLTKTDIVYTGNEIFELEKRIEEEIILAEKENRSPNFIT